MTNSPPTEAFIRDLASRPAPAPLRPALKTLPGAPLAIRMSAIRREPAPLSRQRAARARRTLVRPMADRILPLTGPGVSGATSQPAMPA